MTMRLCVLLAAGLIVATAPAGAQDFRNDEGPRNAVFLELGGNAFLYSVNLERRVERGWLRVGAEYFKDIKGNVIWGVPVSVSTLWGRNTHYLETGLGLSLVSHPNNEEPFLYGMVTLGYRYFRPDSGLMIRAGVTPFFDPFFEEAPGIWPALSVGWSW